MRSDRRAPSEYAVLGAGVLGLTVALRLLQRGARVTIYEREPAVGGLAASFPVSKDPTEDVWLEKFYHHIFRSDTAVQRLMSELGIGQRLIWKRVRTTTFVDGATHQLDSPVSLLRYSKLSVGARLRMGMALAYLRLLPSPASLEGKRASSWLRRVMGDEGYQTVWEPLLRGKFGAERDSISMPWFWARVHDRSSDLGYVRGGFHQLYTSLEQRILALGGDIHLATQVQRIDASEEGITVLSAPTARLSETSQRTFDHVISTLPTATTCRLTPALAQTEYAAKYSDIQAYGAHCLILALDRKLTDSYWININDSGYPFLVLVEHTNYVDAAEYGGRRLIYMGNYRPMDDPLFQRSKEEVISEFIQYLPRFNPAFQPDWITDSWMFAAPYAQPIVTTEYPAHIPPFETPVPHLYLASMFQVYPHDRGQNYSIELAERLIARLVATGELIESPVASPDAPAAPAPATGSAVARRAGDTRE